MLVILSRNLTLQLKADGADLGKPGGPLSDMFVTHSNIQSFANNEFIDYEVRCVYPGYPVSPENQVNLVVDSNC